MHSTLLSYIVSGYFPCGYSNYLTVLELRIAHCIFCFAVNLSIITMSRTLDDDCCEELIELVRARPVLWRKREKNYKDSRTVKQNNWKDVIAELKENRPHLEVTTDIAYKKWVYLKDTFHACRRQYEKSTRSGSGSVSEPKWKFWKCFQWLLVAYKEGSVESSTNLPGLEHSSQASSLGQLSPSYDLPLSPTPATESREGPATETSEAPASETSASTSRRESVSSVAGSTQAGGLAQPSTKKASKRKRVESGESVDTELINVSNQITDMLKSQSAPKDEAQLYAESLVPTFRRLSAYQFALAKKKIGDVLFDMEYGQLPGPSQQMPGVSQQMPGVSQQMPGVFQQMPDVSQQMPGVAQQMPGVSQQMPGVSQQMPGVFQQMPGVSQQMPGVSQQMPGMAQQMPGPSQQMPGPSQQMPGVAQSNLGSSYIEHQPTQPVVVLVPACEASGSRSGYVGPLHNADNDSDNE